MTLTSSIRRRGRTGSHRVGLALASIASLAALAAGARGQTVPSAARPGPEADQRCLQCHAQAHIAELNPAERLSMVGTWLGTEAPPVPLLLNFPDQPDPSEPPTRPGLFITPDHLAGSVHADVRCVECHTDAERLPHTPRLNLRTCASECHTDVAARFAASEHRNAMDLQDPLAPGCNTCHGGHDILPIGDRGAHVHRLNRLHLCGDCHAQHRAKDENSDKAGNIANYLDSTHARAATDAGLVWAATCADCHDAHGVHKSDDPRSTVHRTNVPETCGKCHAGVNEIFANSIHGQLLAEGSEKAPVCTDCHAAHSITRASTPDFARDVINECGHCHDEPADGEGRKGTHYATYRESYHGQVTKLGSTRAASCSDCHGAHDILPLDDPKSRVAEANLIQTCGSCHPGANANFVKFDPHANYRDREKYPLLFGVWLYFLVMMSTVFTIFGLHTILWFLRDLRERMKAGRPKHHHAHGGPAIRRFTRLNIINHVFVMITFFGLTATGIPLVFSHQPWATQLAGMLGGVHAAGLWHRFFAILLGINFVVHFIGLGLSFRNRKGTVREWLFGPNTLLPVWRDVTDFFGMFRWFFRGGKKPRFGKWTYWEKFDYWAEVAGSMIIGFTGLMLWFPLFFSKLIPGWAFNVAMIIHGYEALLAIGFIFTIHFFNAHLRPGTFPVDEVIFTGSIPEHELKETRPAEYDLLVKAGTLESMRVPAPPANRRTLHIVIAVVAVSIGLGLLTLILIGGISSL